MTDDDGWTPNAVGNSLITGGDGEMEGHLTLASQCRSFFLSFGNARNEVKIEKYLGSTIILLDHHDGSV